MIFITVGSQIPFDRLIISVDEWAKENPSKKIFAQIAKTKYIPQNIEWTQFLTPQEFTENINKADVIVSHAGMGVIISCLKINKPILVLPRHSSMRETRNDHQIDTAHALEKKNYIYVAWDEKELKKMLSTEKIYHPLKKIGDYASHELINEINQFIIETDKM